MCTHAYKITKWRPTQRTAVAVCLEFSIAALVNSYDDTMDQENFVLRYESFACYNHGEYLSHSRDILVDERKNLRITKMALSLPHTFAFSCLPRGFWATI